MLKQSKSGSRTVFFQKADPGEFGSVYEYHQKRISSKMDIVKKGLIHGTQGN